MGLVRPDGSALGPTDGEGPRKDPFDARQRNHVKGWDGCRQKVLVHIRSYCQRDRGVSPGFLWSSQN